MATCIATGPVTARAAEMRAAGLGSRAGEGAGAGACAGEGACAGAAEGACVCDGDGTGWPPGPGPGMLPAALYPFGGGSAGGEGILCA